LYRRDRNQLVENFSAEDLVHALAVSRYRRGHQHGVGGRVQLEVLIRMGQSVVGHERCDMRELGGFRLEKFFARRNIKEEIADLDGRPHRQARLFHFENLSAVDFNHGP